MFDTLTARDLQQVTHTRPLPPAPYPATTHRAVTGYDTEDKDKDNTHRLTVSG